MVSLLFYLKENTKVRPAEIAVNPHLWGSSSQNVPNPVTWGVKNPICLKKIFVQEIPRSAQAPAGAATPTRRRLQPASDIKAKLLLCTLGYAERKIPSGEKQNRYLMLFDDRHGLPALQAGAKREFFLIHATQNTACAERGGNFDRRIFLMATFLNEYFLYQQADFLHPTCNCFLFPDTCFEFPDTCFEFPDTCFEFPDTCFEFPDTCFEFPDTCFEFPDTCFEFPDTCFEFPDTCFEFPDTCFEFPDTCFEFPDTCFEFPDTCFEFPDRCFFFKEPVFLAL
jgi:hypothetical protein